MENALYINPDIIAQEIFGDWNSINAIHQSIEYCEKLRPCRGCIKTQFIKNQPIKM